MSRRSQTDPFARIWAGVLIAVAAGAIIWDTVPHWAIYTVGVVLLAAAAVGVVLKARGGRGLALGNPFAALDGSKGDGSPRRLDVSARQALLPLSSMDKAELRMAVGDVCENRRCRWRENPDYEVHHIVPRSAPGSSNKLDNLIVLCPNCHRRAGRGEPNRAMLRLWATASDRFMDWAFLRKWNSMH